MRPEGGQRGGPDVLICCGAGGVGKTTTSAAAAIRLAQAGRRVAVLTIDPARRLADALGIGIGGEAAQRVPIEGPGERGRADAGREGDVRRDRAALRAQR